MSMKDDYIATMHSQIKTWDAEVDKLTTKGEQMNADARAQYAEQLKTMRANRDAAYVKLQEMQAANESAWQQMQAGVDEVWAAMKRAMTQASAQLKQ